jgi:RimJ/RimL family protein N-acetyltransferase
MELNHSDNKLSVREMKESDITRIVEYWLMADKSFLMGMGVDLAKVPPKMAWENIIKQQFVLPTPVKEVYFVIWLLNDIPVGHSNINKIVFGEDASMHLHLWNSGVRHHGMGLVFVRLSLPYFFNNFHLKKIYCEPYALNPAPNRLLAKAAFTFIKKYTTIPGWLNFEQEVNRWEMSMA